MITYDNIIEAQNFLIQQWGEDGKRVVAACVRERPFNNTFRVFLDICPACGGNWGGMLLHGIKEMWPAVYRAIPENMGHQAWACLCYVLALLDVDTSN